MNRVPRTCHELGVCNSRKGLGCTFHHDTESLPPGGYYFAPGAIEQGPRRRAVRLAPWQRLVLQAMAAEAWDTAIAAVAAMRERFGPRLTVVENLPVTDIILREADADLVTTGPRIITKADGVYLWDSEGNKIDLTGCTLAFRMIEINTGVVAVADRPAVSLQTDSDPTTWGRCTYIWGAGETDTPGIYRAWFTVTSGGLSTTFPPDGDWYVLVHPNT